MIEECVCEEGFTKRRIGPPRSRKFEQHKTPTDLHVHDCSYIQRRSALIPQAEKMAAEQCRLDGDRRQVGFSRHFSHVMDLLAKQLFTGETNAG